MGEGRLWGSSVWEKTNSSVCKVLLLQLSAVSREHRGRDQPLGPAHRQISGSAVTATLSIMPISRTIAGHLTLQSLAQITTISEKQEQPSIQSTEICRMPRQPIKRSLTKDKSNARTK